MTNGPEGHAKKPVIISLGEVLWDIFPEGKTAGGAPVNFTYHAIQNGADGYSVSALGNDELGDELEAAVRTAGIHCLFERNSYPTGT
ncbi:MAG: carbohydrate kinase, partial [Scardovia wiggsiae]|nr:carbohydrate kinase [Scardovia wiggsiae]